eukprot:SAG31_NODE_1092_length_9957_cov_10.569284_2_plen_866_part_00
MPGQHAKSKHTRVPKRGHPPQKSNIAVGKRIKQSQHDKKRQPKVQKSSVDNALDESESDEPDVAGFDEYGIPSFLLNLKPDELATTKPQNPGTPSIHNDTAGSEHHAPEVDDQEKEYERAPRTQMQWNRADKKSTHFELPVRGPDGKWTRQERPQPADNEVKRSSTLTGRPDDHHDGDAPVTAPPSDDPSTASVQLDSSTDKTYAIIASTETSDEATPESRADSIAKARFVISSLCAQIVEDPESSIGRLSDLAHLYPGGKLPEGPHDIAQRNARQNKATNHSDRNVPILIDCFTVKKLVILSQLAVFKDICPGYRIRPPSEEEQNMKVSKEVRKLRGYEARLLAEYQFYLQRLSKLASTAEKQESAPRDLGLAVVAVQCLSELLKALHHFNFSGNIVSTLIPVTDCEHQAVIEPARAAVMFLLKTNTYSAAAVTAIKQIDIYCQRRKYRMGPGCLRCILALRLTEDADEKYRRLNKSGIKSGLSGASKSTKAIIDAELERDLAEADAVMPRETRKLAQAEMLRAIFLSYFRVIKSPASVGPGVLQAVLDGVAKFSHLISVDFLGDLFAVLNDLLRTGGLLPESMPAKERLGPTLAWSQNNEMAFQMSMSEALTTVHTALALLSGPRGEVLEIDPATTCTALYFLLPQLAEPSNTELLPVALDALRLALLQRRQLSMSRVAAFVKALLSLATAASAAAVPLALLVFVQQLADKYPRVRRLLDAESSEAAVVGRVVGLGLGPHGGKFRLDVEPDHSNALSTSAWELAALKRHWHPAVVELATAVAAGDKSMTPGSQLQQLFSMVRKEPDLYVVEFFTLACITCHIAGVQRLKAGGVEGAKAVFRLYSDDDFRPAIPKTPSANRRNR